MKNKLLMKLALRFFVVIMLISQSCLISYADVVWEPQDDFYQKHAKECSYVEEDLIANGPGGSVSIWQSPVSDKEIGEIENGSQVFVGFTYDDKLGRKWGVVSRNTGTGWVPMDYLVTEPGLQNFYDKHRDEILSVNDDFKLPDGTNQLCFWTYPGSGGILNSFPIDSDESIGITSSYTDKDGRQWGYVVYFRSSEGWICMSDPGNENIPVNEEDAADVVMPPEPTVIIKPQPESGNIVILVAILVVVVAAVSAVLVRVMFKKKTVKVSDESNK